MMQIVPKWADGFKDDVRLPRVAEEAGVVDPVERIIEVWWSLGISGAPEKVLNHVDTQLGQINIS